MLDVHFSICPPDVTIATKINADEEVWGEKRR